jgi:choline dehydrogenase
VVGEGAARDLRRTRFRALRRQADVYPSPAPVDDNEAADHVRRYAESLYHPVGTCMMGNGQYAVVDADLRVHGLERLRVVNASVMPTIPRGHTHASTVMIAEKASDLIRESVPDRAPEHSMCEDLLGSRAENHVVRLQSVRE